MKMFLASLISVSASVAFTSVVWGADLIPEAANVSSLIAVAQTCGATSDCKTNLASITTSLESRGFVILKTDACTTRVIYETCPDGTRPTEVARVYFVR